MWDEFEPCQFVPFFWEKTLFNYDLFSECKQLQEKRLWGTCKNRRTVFAPDLGSHCVHRQLCASASLCKMTCEVQLGVQGNPLIAPGTAMPFLVSPLNPASQITSFESDLFLVIWLSYHRNHTWHQRSHGAAFQSHHPLQQETRQDSQVGSSPQGTHLSRTARNNILVLLEEAKKSEMLAQFLLTLNLQGLKGRNNPLKDTLMPWFIIWFVLVAIYL